jgi:hypothetical protein
LVELNMPVPWLRILDTVLGLTDVARRMRTPPQPRRDESSPQDLAAAARGGLGGPIEARLAGVVVAALKEAFDRDHQRMELERDQAEAERRRAERALRLELLRQAGDREIGRLRMLAAIAVASWLGTLVFAAQLLDGAAGVRAAIGGGLVLLLAAFAASFTAQANLGRALAQAPLDDTMRPDALTGGTAGAAVPWLIVAGLASVGLAGLF